MKRQKGIAKKYKVTEVEELSRYRVLRFRELTKLKLSNFLKLFCLNDFESIIVPRPVIVIDKCHDIDRNASLHTLLMKRTINEYMH